MSVPAGSLNTSFLSVTALGHLKKPSMTTGKHGHTPRVICVKLNNTEGFINGILVDSAAKGYYFTPDPAFVMILRLDGDLGVCLSVNLWDVEMIFYK